MDVNAEQVPVRTLLELFRRPRSQDEEWTPDPYRSFKIIAVEQIIIVNKYKSVSLRLVNPAVPGEGET